MFLKTMLFLPVFFLGSLLVPADDTLTVLDCGAGSCLQEFFGRVFSKEDVALPQDLSINITAAGTDVVNAISAENVVIADDGLLELKLPENCLKSVYAYIPVVLAVNKSNPLDDVNPDTLQRIYSGRAGDWSRVGGKSGKIVLAGYPGDSAVGRVFRKKVMQQDLSGKVEPDINKTIAPDLIICQTPEAAAALVQSSGSVIVFGGAGLLKNAAGKYKILKVNGILPSKENLLSGRYKLFSEHSIISSRNKPPAKLAALLDFLRLSAAKNSRDMLPVK